jgi:hypothetical protein
MAVAAGKVAAAAREAEYARCEASLLSEVAGLKAALRGGGAAGAKRSPFKTMSRALRSAAGSAAVPLKQAVGRVNEAVDSAMAPGGARAPSSRFQ